MNGHSIVTRAKREERLVLNQTAQPGAEPPPQVSAAAAPAPVRPAATRPHWSPRGLWAALARPPATATVSDARLRVELLSSVAPGVVCGAALLTVQGAAINWTIAGSELFAAVFALAGVATLFTARRSPGVRANRHDANLTLGGVWLAVAALCALPMLLSGMLTAALALALVGVAYLLYAIDAVRPRIAPLDELLTPLCLGPGLLCLTLVAQGQRLTGVDWLMAGALGGVAFAVIVGLRMRAAVAADDEAKAMVENAHAGRSLATVFGTRVASALIAIALLASYALVVAMAVPRGGWPGALLALTSAPVALVGFSGLAVSSYLPARQSAARQLLRAYLWFGLALAVGLALTLVAQQIIQAITRAVGG